MNTRSLKLNLVGVWVVWYLAFIVMMSAAGPLLFIAKAYQHHQGHPYGLIAATIVIYVAGYLPWRWADNKRWQLKKAIS